MHRPTPSGDIGWIRVGEVQIKADVSYFLVLQCCVMLKYDVPLSHVMLYDDMRWYMVVCDVL